MIRPLAYVAERDIARYARGARVSHHPLHALRLAAQLQRQAVKAMLQDWEREHPGRLESIFSSLQNVAPSQLADPALFDFAGLEALARRVACRDRGSSSSAGAGAVARRGGGFVVRIVGRGP